MKRTTGCTILAILTALFASNFEASYAQLIPSDGNFSTQTKIEKSDNIFRVLGGTKSSKNLFHSFDKFNVDSTNVVKFINNDFEVINVIGRVTSSSRSSIFGTIQASGTNSGFNLFLLNPNGFLFGPGAFIDLNGSFTATTANAVKFGNKGLFSTDLAGDLSQLSVNPSALLFNNISRTINRSNGIEVSGSFFEVGNSVSPSNLLLLGGEVTIENSVLTAPDGLIEIGGLNDIGEINLFLTKSKGYRSIFTSQNKKSNIKIYNGSLVDVSNSGLGNIKIYSNDLEISSNSILSSDVQFGGVLNTKNKGSIILDSQGKIIIDDSLVITGVFPGNTGDAPDIRANANSIILMNDASIASFSAGDGIPGDIYLDIVDDIYIIKSSSILNSSDQSTINNSNNSKIAINASSLSLSGGSFINSSTAGLGRGGDVKINVKGSISLSESLAGETTAIKSGVQKRGAGNAGNVEILSDSLSITGGAQIQTAVFSGGDGLGGNIRIDSKSVYISGFGIDGIRSGLVASTESGARGAAGSVSIDTSRLEITNGAVISAQTFNSFPGGNILVNTDYLSILNGGQILSNTVNSGNAGNVTINALKSVTLRGSDPSFSERLKRLTINNNGNSNEKINELIPFSGLFASTSGDGAGGDISVTTGRFNLQDNAVVDVRTLNNGLGGNIVLKANSFSATRGGQLLSTTSGNQTAGNIKLDVIDSISFDGTGTGVFATTTHNSTGTGGNIDIDPRIVLVLNGAEITASSSGEGPAGNVNLQAGNLTLDRGKILATSTSGQGGDLNLDIDNFLFLTNGSQISATAGNRNTSGDGGNVTINTELLVALNNSDITANAFTGKGGNIQITTRGLFQSPDSNITASSENGVNGQVNINNPEVDPSESLSELPESVEPPQDIAKGCRPGQTLGDSNFVHVGRGGLPPGPHEAQTPSTVWKDLRANNLQPSYATAVDTSPTPLASETFKVGLDIVEAKGWTKDSQGRIYLTANVPQPAQSPQPIATC